MLAREKPCEPCNGAEKAEARWALQMSLDCHWLRPGRPKVHSTKCNVKPRAGQSGQVLATAL